MKVFGINRLRGLGETYWLLEFQSLAALDKKWIVHGCELRIVSDAITDNKRSEKQRL